ncbi:hypothetical protein ACGFWE_40225 [Streptomyces sp. NPDC048523]|uniref:hypothetical protein n=1 Tax=Streptomyces sp. NPDC048523 TaxID=3365567 RepID=UPI003719E7C5
MAEQGARQMLPEVRKYVESLDAASAARDAAVVAVAAKYPKRFGYGEDEKRQARAFNEEADAAYDAWNAAKATAWDALKASSDPLVKWIAENCGQYKGEAQHVLTALPATVDELDELADRQDWCGVWGAFRQQAIDAGLMPGVTPPSPARKAVFDQIDKEGCCRMGASAKVRIGKALDALISEALATAASPTEAKTVEATA